ncbi:MAG: TonB family protein [Alphaproteobacteria bacterium]|nr:TonB family protein [Alphaproteobacteria bacterium]
MVNCTKNRRHAEEHPKGASRSTHARDAPLLTIPEAGAPGWIGRDSRVQVKEAGRWSRLRGPVGSLVLHLLPLLLLFILPVTPPAETEPIPVQLVFEPPPKAAPAPPQPQPKPTPPPPRGRLASEDLGEPEAKEVDKPKGDPPAADKPAKTETPPAETKPPEKPQQMAAVAPPLPPAKSDAPKPDPVPKPAPKPTPAAHQVPRRVEEPGNLAPRRGRFPGPAASRDEYLAYMHSLIRQHYNMLSPAMLGDRRGMTVIEFVVLDDGKIALLKVRRSSGWPDIDNRVAEMVAAVGHFPPLPQWFQGLAMPFEFGFPFPEALRE